METPDYTAEQIDAILKKAELQRHRTRELLERIRARMERRQPSPTSYPPPHDPAE